MPQPRFHVVGSTSWPPSSRFKHRPMRARRVAEEEEEEGSEGKVCRTAVRKCIVFICSLVARARARLGSLHGFSYSPRSMQPACSICAQIRPRVVNLADASGRQEKKKVGDVPERAGDPRGKVAKNKTLFFFLFDTWSTQVPAVCRITWDHARSREM